MPMMRRFVWPVSECRRKAGQSKRRRLVLPMRLASIRMWFLNPKIYGWLADGYGQGWAAFGTTVLGE
jgi:hypothetical protein